MKRRWPPPGGQRHRVGVLDDVRVGIQDLEDALATGDRPLRLADQHADRAEGPDEQPQEEEERHELTEAQAIVDDEDAPVGQDRGEPDRGEEAEQRLVEGLQAVAVHAAREGHRAAPAEATGLGLLLPEGLDHPHADDALLGRLRQLGHLLLRIHQHRAGAAARARRDGDQKRPDGECDERQERVDEEHDRGHDHQRQEVHREEDEPVAEEEAHGLQVAGDARHQLADAHLVEVAKRHVREVAEDSAAQVGLDAQAHQAGEHPPGHREEEAQDPDPDDGQAQERQPVAARVLVDVADHHPREERQGHRACDDPDGGEDHEEHLPTVRPQEAEQANEDAHE